MRQVPTLEKDEVKLTDCTACNMKRLKAMSVLNGSVKIK
jgi:hypothetical protein